MRKGNKILAVALAVMMMLPSTLGQVTLAHAEAEVEESTVEEVVVEEELLDADGVTATSESSFEWNGTEIAKFIGSETQVVIPAKATSIDRSAFSGKSITSVDFSLSAVKMIRTAAFGGCTSLQTVTLPSTLTGIGDNVFYGCTSLSSITIPASVTQMSNSVFEGCTKLTKVTINAKSFTAGSSIFGNCSDQLVVTLPSGMTTIPANLFSNASIKSITIPSTVTTIGSSAFAGSNLTSITIPANTKTLGSKMFQGCTALSSVSILSSPTSIPDSAFNGCTALCEITLPNSVYQIGERAFASCTGLTEFTMPPYSGTAKIGAYAFRDCTNLKKITLNPKSVSFGANTNTAFYNVPDLTIYGHAGSTVEEYAKTYGIPFVAFSSEEPEPATYTVIFNANGATSGSMSNQTINSTGQLNANTFKKTGYKFKGWNTLANGSGTAYADRANVSYLAANGASITLYAQWELENYTITYNLNGGTNNAGNPSTYTYTTSTIILLAPTKEESTFIGWYSDSSFTTQVTQITKGSTGNITLYAKWNTKEYTITYNLNGGTWPSGVIAPTKYTKATDTITLPTPTKKGYSFGGWYSDSGFTTQVTQIAKGSTGNKTFYAKWTISNYTITYELNGGTNNAGNPSSYTIETETITLANASKNGYTFGGWYSDSSLSTKVTQIAKGSTGNKKFYAKWTKKSYTITYELNGGTNNSNNPASYDIETATITLADATKKGYDFAGWYSDSSLNTKVTQIAKGSTGNKTFYAKWTVKTYTITYNLNGGINNGGNPANYTIETETITLANPTKNGYTFGGWYSDSSFSTKVTQIAKGSTGNKTFYAKWTKKSYTITYELNGGTNNSSNPDSYNIETATINLADPTKKGYDFAGWYTDSACNGQRVYQITQGSTGNKTFYAKWTVKNYNIIYNLNGGINNGSNPWSYNIETATITLAAPTRDGYIFDGWYTNASCTPETKLVQIAKGSIGDIVLYAKWIDASIPPVTVKTPTGLAVKASAYNKLTLSWNAVSGVTGYEIYRSTSKTSGFKKIATVSKASTVSYANSGVVTGTAYYYKILAYKVVDGTTFYSDMTTVVSGKTTLDKTTISKIESASSTSIKLTWKKISGATGYEIYRATSKSGTYSKVTTIKSGSTVTYTNTKLTLGKTYYYKIRAYRTEGSKNVYSSYSSIVSGQTYTNTESFVARIYTKALGRDPEPAGLKYWSGEINAKRKTPVEVAELFIFSPEFTNKNLNDTEYVKVLYRTFMGREYDQAGLNYWLSQMKAGKTRKQVLESFASCKEFQDIIKSFGL